MIIIIIIIIIKIIIIIIIIITIPKLLSHVHPTIYTYTPQANFLQQEPFLLGNTFFFLLLQEDGASYWREGSWRWSSTRGQPRRENLIVFWWRRRRTGSKFWRWLGWWWSCQQWIAWPHWEKRVLGFTRGFASGTFFSLSFSVIFFFTDNKACLDSIFGDHSWIFMCLFWLKWLSYDDYSKGLLDFELFNSSKEKISSKKYGWSSFLKFTTNYFDFFPSFILWPTHIGIFFFLSIFFSIEVHVDFI